MNDNDIYRIIKTILIDGFAFLSIPNVKVKQSYQPTNQGLPFDPIIFIHKISNYRYGFTSRKFVYNSVDDDFDTVVSTWRYPTFQISGLSIQDPSNINSLTASDIVESAADILQLPTTREILNDAGIGIDRIQGGNIVYFKDDRNRHEANPSFDFKLSYKKDITYKTPRVTRQQSNIAGV